MKSWKPAEIYRPIPKNVVVYDGPSRLTGDPILVVATAQNGNRKIGRMLQFWIIPATSPLAALRTGSDRSVCGDCRLRGDGTGRGRVCYVWSPGVENIWQSAQKPARTDRMSAADFAPRVAGLQLRIAAYGDPTAAPFDAVWRPLLAVAGGWTAYTHQWRRDDLTVGYREWCMASVDSAAEQAEAVARGWRTFRVRTVDGELRDAVSLARGREIICPHERDETVKCAACELCRGASRPARNIVVTVHGAAGRKHFPLTVVGAAR